ncbi:MULTISPECIES: energy transducer TonB [Altibacter]|uniref:energy transducer TonB n=1 Tax=Altibacter TaxID=1535231 RepID=UPI00054F6E36|nr:MULTISPECIES: energy transducer TonB [Altibacter]MCW8980358.1 energy transducer TonB [Altibacter sp.]MCW9037171.1 energy transducer TonB [Altibacter sp.]
MKKVLLIICIVFSTTLFAQEEWGNIQKNTVTLSEIPPIWPGCESGSVTVRKNCFNQKLAQHISKNFKYPAEEYKNNVEGKVIVEFIVNEKGIVEVKNVSGGTPALQAEAKRNILAIPKMTKPGMMGGKPRAIKYTVPFTFKTGK